MLLYIHIPFCDSKCHYCAFNSYTYLHSYKDRYMKALNKQLKSELEKYNKKIETIFIGGGTPSTVEASYYADLLSIARPFFENNNIEITIEANPNSATLKWQKEIFDTGINRISFGVQSFNDEKLSFLGRNHNRSQAIEAINNASKVGFKNINCDIIYDTLLDTKELLKNDLEVIKTLPVNHISAYSLTIEEGTKFYGKNSVKVENEENARFLFEKLEQMGFMQYEISNFALDDGAKSKHNLGYWQYKEYLGVGSGAVGCLGNKRFYNENDVVKYIENPLKYSGMEELSKNDIFIEKLLLGFRSEVGVEKSLLSDEQYKKVLDLEEVGKVTIKGDKIYSNDFMLADELALYIEG